MTRAIHSRLLPEAHGRLTARDTLDDKLAGLAVGGDDYVAKPFADLLGNVREHTPARTSTCVRVAEADGEAVVEVEDDGPGLTEDQSAQVFERFYRADPSRSRRHGGAGLGLAIVAAVIEAHDGSVAASPAPPHGARLTVRLPVASEVEEAEPAAKVAEKGSRGQV
jgi:two-component system OmpR family sensor kinase